MPSNCIVRKKKEITNSVSPGGDSTTLLTEVQEDTKTILNITPRSTIARNGHQAFLSSRRLPRYASSTARLSIFQVHIALHRGRNPLETLVLRPACGIPVLSHRR